MYILYIDVYTVHICTSINSSLYVDDYICSCQRIYNQIICYVMSAYHSKHWKSQNRKQSFAKLRQNKIINVCDNSVTISIVAKVVLYITTVAQLAQRQASFP